MAILGASELTYVLSTRGLVTRRSDRAGVMTTPQCPANASNCGLMPGSVAGSGVAPTAPGQDCSICSNSSRRE